MLQSRFYTLFGVLVVLWLYGLSSLFTVARLLKFQRLHLKENLDTITELKDLVP